VVGVFEIKVRQRLKVRRWTRKGPK